MKLLRILLGAVLASATMTTLGSGVASIAGAATSVPTCNSSTFTITPLSDTTYYVDSNHSIDSQYIGYSIQNNGSPVSSAWATLGNFRGLSSTIITLAPHENSAHSLGDLASSASTAAYWLTSDLSYATTTSNSQFQDLTIYNGDPTDGGTAVCTYTFTIATVMSLIQANANKVTNVSVSGTPALGGTFTIEQDGQTGTIGAGPAWDPGVFYMTPASNSSWPASSFQLISTQLTFCATAPCSVTTSTIDNQLHLINQTGTDYTAIFTFQVVGGTTSTTAISPNVDIASGQPVKHTGTFPASIPPIPRTSITQYLSIGAGTPSMNYPGGTDAYTVTLLGSTGMSYQSFTVAMPSGASYVPGSSTWSGLAISDPAVVGSTLTFTHQFNYTGPSNTLVFSLKYPPSAGAGNFATSVTGLSGQVTIGDSAGSSTPASASIAINAVALTVTPINESILQGNSATYHFAVSGFVNNETTSTAAGWVAPVCTSSTNVGTNTITCSGGSATDYTFTYNTGTLTVIGTGSGSLTYDGNGQTSGTAPTVSGNLPYTVASGSGLTKTGYVFGGWCTVTLLAGATCSSVSGTTYQPGDQFTSSTPTTLYAIWVAVATYAVIYNANGATSGTAPTDSSSPYEPGATVTVLGAGTLVKTGAVFSGWNTAANGTGTSYAQNQTFVMPAVAVNLYAQFATQYTVTYNLNGAQGTMPTAQTFTFGSSDSISAYGGTSTFIGWNTLTSPTTSIPGTWYQPGDTYSLAANITLYAQVAAHNSLSFDGNGGTGVPAPLTWIGNGNQSIPTGTPTRVGYTFISWNTLTSPTTSIPGTTYNPGGTYKQQGNIDLYAQWTPFSYSVTYASNGATGSLTSQTFTYGSSVVLLSSTGLTYAGYTFSGWNTAANGSGVAYSVGASYGVGANLLLYAIWAPNTYVVNYSLNGSPSTPPATQFFTTGSSVTIDSGSSLTYSGYSFVGWNTAADGSGTFYAGSSSYATASNLTLFAVWDSVNVYAVSYNPNYATSGVAPATQNVYAGSSVTVQGNVGSPVLARTGYTFSGWNTAANGSGRSYATGDVYSASANLTLYAQWVAVTYSLNYSSNGGTGAVASTTFTVASPATLASGSTLALAGYTFGGWNTLANGTGTTYPVSSTYALTGNVTLYAFWVANSNTVSYDINGATGTTPTAQTFTTGNSVTLATGSGFTYSGCTFEGWSTSSQAGSGSACGITTSSIAGTSYGAGATYSTPASVALFAVWVTSTTITVTFNANGGTGTMGLETYSSGAQALTANTYGYSGYTFSGWSTLAGGGGTTYSDSQSITITSSLILFAQWTASTWTVSYNASGGTGSTPSSTNFTTGGSAPVASGSGLSETGFVFTGWNTAANGSGASYAAGDTYSVAASTMLYAQWVALTYFVSYDANGGTGTVPSPTSFSTGGSTTIGSGAGLSYSGYTFVGWNTATDGSGTSYLASSSYSTTASLTLYALWDPASTYQVTFLPNGSTSGSPPATQYFQLNGTTTIPSSGSMTLTGYNFVGWNTVAGGTGVSYVSGDVYSTSANLTLYAIWVLTSTYAITYDGNGATGGSPPAVQTFSTSATVAGNTGSLSLSGFVFNGWGTSAGGGTSYAAGSTYSVLANVTLFAQWTTVPYTVTYDANSGSGSVATQSFNLTSGDVISASTGMTRSTYKFIGWNSAPDGSGTTYSPGDSYDLPINLYLYAQWASSSSYAVIYNPNGGTGSVATQTFTSGSVSISSGGALTRSGYTFVTWNTSADGTGSRYAPTTSYSTTQNLTLYAQWTATTYNVAYDANGGSGTAPTTQNFTVAGGDTISGVGSLTDSGYSLGGWNTASDGTGEAFAVGQSYNQPYNLSLYAVWTPTSQSVTYDLGGGTGISLPTQANVATGATFTVYNSTNPTKTGYTFGGWSDGSSTYTDGAIYTMGTSNVTLTAVWTANSTDTIDYSATSGTGVTTATTGADGTTVTLGGVGTMALSGYALSGWCTVTLSAGATCSSVSGTSYSLSQASVAISSIVTTPGATATLYAVWVAGYSDTIDYSATSGTGATTATTGPDGTTVTLGGVGTMALSGYALSGWCTVTLSAGATCSSVSGTSYSLSQASVAISSVVTTPGATATLYAVWTPTSQSVTYSLGGGTGISLPTQANVATAATFNVYNSTNPTKSGYTFGGWSDGTSTYADNALYTMGASNVTLTAVWTPTSQSVTYDLGGGTGISLPTQANVATAATFNVYNSTNPTKSGYTFGGWSDGTSTYADNALYTMGASNVTLTAVWTPTSQSVTYSLGGGTGISLPTQANVATAATFNVYNSTNPTKSGYTFGGWSDGTSTYADNALYTMGASNVTLTAVWTPTSQSVTYSLGGGTGISLPTQANVATAATFNVYNSTNPTKSGYTFGGWSDGTSTYADNALYTMGASNVTLTAVWTPTSTDTIHYSNNSGTGSESDTSANDGVNVTLSDGAALVAPSGGYQFAGWCSAQPAAGATCASVGGTSYAASASGVSIGGVVGGSGGSATLYAIWAPQTVVVTFSANGGVGAPSPEDETYDVSTALSGNTATHAGETFVGWNTAANGTGTSYSNRQSVAFTANVTLYAQWSAVTTSAATSVTYISATLNGTVNPGGASITTTGFCYSTSFMTDCSGSPSTVSASPANPTGTSAEAVSANVASLAPLTQYYYQTFATNSSDVTTYGAIVTFATGYTVVYNPEGGSVTPTHVNVEPGQTLTLETTTYPGNRYRFVAWNTAQHGGSPVGTEGDTFNPEYPLCPNYPANPVCLNTTENTVPVVALYATWSTITYTVTYNAGAGSVTVTSPCLQTSSSLASCAYVTGSPSLTLPTPTLAGSTFEGWNTAADSSGTDVGGGTYTPTSSITLYAQWTTTPATYTVSFNPDSGSGSLGGSGTVTAMAGSQGSRITLPGGTGFTPPAGYGVFAGWSTTESSASVGNVVDYHTNSSYTISANVTLYAVWLPNSTGGGAPVFTSTSRDTFSYSVGGSEQIYVTGAPTIALSAAITGADDAQLQPGDVTLAFPGSGSCAGSCVDGTLTVSASTIPGTYAVVLTAQNSFGINTQIYTFTVESPYAPTQVVAATDLTAANTVYVSWVAPAKGNVVSYDVTPTDASPGAGSGTLATITGISPTTSCAGSGISGLCFVVSGPAGNDTLIGGDTYDFVVTAVFDSNGTESSATSNYTLPTVVAPSGSTGANAIGTASNSQSGASTAAVGSAGSSGYVSATAVGQGVVSVGAYDSNPASGVFSAAGSTQSYDVSISPGSQFSSVSFEICGVGSNGEIDWYDSLNGQSYAVAPAPVAVSGSPTCYTVSLDATSVPTSNDQTLYGSLFFVPSTGGGGNPPPPVAPAVVSVPTVPQDVSASPGDTTATVTWTTPSSDGGSAITGYLVTSGPGGFTCTVSEPSANTCVVPGLTNGTTYTFTVVAMNSGGDSLPGGPSNPVVPEGPVAPAVVSVPTVPPDVSASPGDTTATVTWTTPSSDGGSAITGYLVTSGPGGFTCTVSEPSANTCVVPGLTNGTTYTFTVVAINSQGDSSPGGPSNPVVPEGPKPPLKKPLRVIVTLDPFVTASATLLPKMEKQLINLAKLIKRDVGTMVSITGFTDSRANAAYNYTLGLQRAKSAYVFLRNELRRLHVKIDFPITFVSKGLTSAAASNASAAGQAKNRRVVLIAWLK